jgi:hypothetical protein
VQQPWSRLLHKRRERCQLAIPEWRGHVQLIDARVKVRGEALEERRVQIVDERRFHAGRHNAKPWQAVAGVRPPGLHKGIGQKLHDAIHPVAPCRYGGGACGLIGAELREDLVPGAEAAQIGVA